MTAQRSDLARFRWLDPMPEEGRTIAERMQALDTSQWLAADVLAAYQFRQLAPLAAHFARFSPHFRQRLADAGLTAAEVATPEGFQRLPPLGRRDIQTAEGFFAGMLPAGHGPASELNTSGSTGEPVHIRRTAVNQIDWFALTMRDHLWHRRDLRGRFATIRAHLPGVTERPHWGAPAALVTRTGRALAIPMTVPIAEQVRLLEAFRPTSLLLYPSNLDGIFDHIERHGGRLKGLRDLRTIGESLSDRTRERASTLLGAQISDSYSSQEFGYIALQCPESGLYHAMSETLIVEIVRDDGTPAAEGEIGRLLLTDLRNSASPLIRYDIRDHAERGPPCPCGRALPTLRRILGRSRNLLVKPDGSRSWPQVGFARFRALAKIVQYQFIQHDLEHVEMKLVVEEPLSAGQEAALRTHVQSAMGHPFAIALTYCDGRVPTGPNGKFEEFISRVAA